MNRIKNKDMQNILILIFLALCTVSYGCSDSTRAQNLPTNKEVFEDNKIKEVNSHIDSLKSELFSLKKELKEQKRTIDNQQKEIKTLKEKKSEIPLIWIIIVSVVSILVLYLMRYFYITLRDIKNRLDRHRSDIYKLSDRIKEYESRTSKTPISNPQKEDCPKNNYRYKPMENKPITPTIEIAEEKIKPEMNVKETKEGYFGMLIGNSYFNECMVSKNDNALFKAWVGDTEGEYTVLKLDAIRSVDGIENAVCMEGVPIKEAKNFQVIEKGKVKKNSKGNWSIVSPTKIKLS